MHSLATYLEFDKRLRYLVYRFWAMRRLLCSMIGVWLIYEWYEMEGALRDFARNFELCVVEAMDISI